MSDSEPASASYIFTLSAVEDETLTLIFEPVWGELELQPGEVFRGAVSGPGDDPIEIGHGPGFVEIWPGPHTSIAVLNDRGETVRVIK